MDPITVIEQRLKKVLRHLPAPVGIVTSYDPSTDLPVGLAMSALMPVSLAPCAMAIAVNRSGSAHDAMVRAGRFCVNLLGGHLQESLAPFASPIGREHRFAGPEWKQRDRVWFIESAPACIFCRIEDRMTYGTHDLLIGAVYDLDASGDEDILGWANGSLGRLAPVQPV